MALPKKTVKVVDEWGVPLANANVYARSDSRRGRASDSGGIVQIDFAVNENEWIRFSYLGYTTKDIPFNSIGSVVELEQEAMTQDPVIITVPKKKNTALWIGAGLGLLVLIGLMAGTDEPKKVKM